MSEEEREDIVARLFKHFENPEPISPPKGGRKYGGKFRKYSSSSKGNRKSLSDNENNDHTRSPTQTDLSNGLITEAENMPNDVTVMQENGNN